MCAALLLVASAAGCGRLGFDATAGDGGGSGSGDGGLIVPRCPIPARPDVSAPMTTVTTCTESAARDAIAAGGVVVFDCPAGTMIAVGSPLQVSTTTVIAGHGVTFDGQGAVMVMQVTTGGDLTLLDTTITRGHTTSAGSGIRVEFGASLVVYDSVFTDNVGPATGGDAGGAIAGLPNDATVAIYGSRFERNNAANGGGVAAYADLTIANSVFKDNQATDPAGVGGGIYAVGDGDLSLCEVTVENNLAGGLSGGIQRISTSADGNDHWDRVHVRNNTTTDGVGGAYVQDVALTLRQVDIADNSGTDTGGLWFESPGHAIDAENLSVIGNTASNGVGGGVRLNAQSGRIAFSTFANNTASCGTCFGGAVTGLAPVTLTATVMTDNSAGGTPGTCQGTALEGGANFQWPPDTNTCSPSVTVVEPALGAVQDVTGVDGTYRVRRPGAGTVLTVVTSGCPATDIIGRPRPATCTAGALEP